MALLDQYFGFGKSLPSFDDAVAAGQPPVDETAASDEARALAAERLKRGAKRAVPQLPDWGEPGTQITSPTSQVGMLNSGSLGINARPALTPNMGDPSGAGEPPTANDPMASEPQVFKDGVPVPKPRPTIPGDPTSNVPDRAPITDASSSNAQAPLSMAPGGPQPQQQGAGISGMLGNLLKQENAPLLLSLAGGFAGAPSFGTGMRRAFSGAAPAAMQLQQLQQKNTSQASLYKSLMDRGVPPAEALAAATDPNMLKIIGAKYFETKPSTVHDITDALGSKTPVVFDPSAKQGKGEFRDMSGKPIDAASGAGPGGTGAPQLLAPGVKYDPTLTGDDHLNQFSPEVKAAVKAYMNGDVMPSGNARMNSINTFAKTQAQRYGQEMGIPVSDALYSEKRKYRTELGSGTANSVGGQVKAFNQGIEHAGSLADKIEKLGNYDPLGIPLVAHGINAAREALSTTQKSKANEVNAIGQTLAGEVGKLFSGQAGGGVHERELTRQRFNSVTSNKELAGALEATLETMGGGLKALEQGRDRVLGPNSGVEFVNADTRKKMERIQQVITRLKSGEAAPAAPPAGKTGSGINWSIVQ